jgi:hypothetical protein
MKLSVVTNHPLIEYYLEDLNDKKIFFKLDEEFDLPSGWYNLIIPFKGTNTEIKDIKINGASIGYVINTGFFTERTTGKIFQPANAIWNDGYYSIWLHTEVGMLIETIYRSITNGDYGKNLFEKYLLSVDKPVILDNTWPEITKSIFRNAHGPRWWKRNIVNTPYEPLEKNQLQHINKNLLLQELKMDLTHESNYEILNKFSGAEKMKSYSIRKKSCLPLIDVKDLKSKYLQEFCELVGYKRVLNIRLQGLDPDCSYNVHIDDYVAGGCQQYLQGPSILLWNLSNNNNQSFFKLGEAGCLPIDNGVFFNHARFAHTTINVSNSVRYLLIINGDRTDYIHS